MRKITTLIPAYKAEHLGELFFALRKQTFKDFRIIISDDSPNAFITQLLQSQEFRPALQGLEVELIQGPRKGGYQNVVRLLETWNGSSELFHVMLDDDIIYPPFYAYHVNLHQVVIALCSVSRRWTSNASGLPVSSLNIPPYVERNISRAIVLESDALFRSTVATCTNWLGELSNVIFRNEAAVFFKPPELGNILYTGLEDIGLYLALSLQKPLIFIQDYLGFFRMHPEQNTAKLLSTGIKAGHLAWCALAVASLQLGKITAAEALGTFKRIDSDMRMLYSSEAEMQPFFSLFSATTELNDDVANEFCTLWNAFLKAHNLP